MSGLAIGGATYIQTATDITASQKAKALAAQIKQNGGVSDKPQKLVDTAKTRLTKNDQLTPRKEEEEPRAAEQPSASDAEKAFRAQIIGEPGLYSGKNAVFTPPRDQLPAIEN